MKTFMILLLCAAIALVVAEDTKGPASHHDAQQHESHGSQQHLKQQESHDQHHQQQQHPASQQHSVKQNQQHQPQPAPYKHKREAPKDTAAGHSTTVAPKATVDPKQPSVLPAIIGQAPKNKRDTVAAQPAAAARPATNAPPKGAATGATTNGQQRKTQSAPRPTAVKQSRDQPANKPQSTVNSKVPATVNQPGSNPTTANPAKKV
uniref:Uncharacterized protein n=1 Tax=Anopheles christyi TaxID=43041 RepID=A0A182JPV6_9DIPT